MESSITSSLSADANFYYNVEYSDDTNTIFVNHTHKYETLTIAPTCSSVGFDQNECWCGRVLQNNVVDMIPHDNISELISPTCTTGGVTRFTCNNCGFIEVVEETKALGHSIGDWEITMSPTIYSYGEKQRSCSVCPHIETESLPKITGGVVRLVDKSKTMGTLISEPSSSFGSYYSQAYAMYECIKNGDAGAYSNWPSNIYGPSGYAHFTLPIDGIDDMDYNDQQIVANNVVRSFESRFNRTVLNNTIYLSMNMWDVVPGGVSIHINPSSANAKLVAQVKDDVFYNTCVNKIGLYDGMPQTDAIVAINNWMCNYIVYDSGSDPFEVLNTGKAICGGYAALFKQLCTSAGIDCEYVSGCYHGDPNCIPCHAWNKVKLNGAWYWVDVCWNDTGNDKNAYLLSPVLWGNRIVS